MPSLVEIKSWDQPSDEKTCIDSEKGEMTRPDIREDLQSRLSQRVPAYHRAPQYACLYACLPACQPTRPCMYVCILELNAQLLLSQLANAHVSLSCLIPLTHRVRPFLMPLPHRAAGANRNIKGTK